MRAQKPAFLELGGGRVSVADARWLTCLENWRIGQTRISVFKKWTNEEDGRGSPQRLNACRHARSWCSARGMVAGADDEWLTVG